MIRLLDTLIIFGIALRTYSVRDSFIVVFIFSSLVGVTAFLYSLVPLIGIVVIGKL